MKIRTFQVSPTTLLLVAQALVAGALLPLAFSPIDCWPLQLLSTAWLYTLWRERTPRMAATLGFTYGLGAFGVGVSWVYVSIHDYGAAPPAVAGVITLGFVLLLSSYLALQGYVYRRCCAPPWSLVPGFAATWVLGEWLRGWLFTGFPWLYLGYAHVTSVFSGLAPLFGVLGLSFFIALSGALLGELSLRWRRSLMPPPLSPNPSPASGRGEFVPLPRLRERSMQRHAADLRPRTRFLGRGWGEGNAHTGGGFLGSKRLVLLLSGLWIACALLRGIAWTTPLAAPPLRVGLVQGNVEQSVKFDSAHLQEGLNRYATLSAPLWHDDLVVWPETAIPLLYQREPALMQQLHQQASASGTTLISGVFYADNDTVHNSLATFGNGSGVWHKQKLVPFGEYVPLRRLLAGLLQVFELPQSSLEPGPAAQDLLTAGPARIAPFICYEVVYPDFVRRYGRAADLLLTVSNDTWFGASWGPHQHLQMAAMRARELGRYMVRATNNGLSALIDERGRLIATAPQFTATTLQGEVRRFGGSTPFARWGSWPVLLLSLGLAVAAAASTRRPLNAATTMPSR